MFYIFYLINFATQRLQQATFFLLSKYGLSHPLLVLCLPGVLDSAADNSSVSQWVFTIMEKVPHFTFKTLIRNYANQAAPVPYDFCAVSQFHVYSPGVNIRLAKCHNSVFQLGEGPSRGLLRDCTASPMDRFAALTFPRHLRHPAQSEWLS